MKNNLNCFSRYVQITTSQSQIWKIMMLNVNEVITFWSSKHQPTYRLCSNIKLAWKLSCKHSQGDLNPQYHHHIQDSRFILFAPTTNLHKIWQNSPIMPIIKARINMTISRMYDYDYVIHNIYKMETWTLLRILLKFCHVDIINNPS